MSAYAGRTFVVYFNVYNNGSGPPAVESSGRGFPAALHQGPRPRRQPQKHRRKHHGPHQTETVTATVTPTATPTDTGGETATPTATPTTVTATITPTPTPSTTPPDFVACYLPLILNLATPEATPTPTANRYTNAHGHADLYPHGDTDSYAVTPTRHANAAPSPAGDTGKVDDERETTDHQHWRCCVPGVRSVVRRPMPAPAPGQLPAPDPPDSPQNPAHPRAESTPGTTGNWRSIRRRAG